MFKAKIFIRFLLSPTCQVFAQYAYSDRGNFDYTIVG